MIIIAATFIKVFTMVVASTSPTWLPFTKETSSLATVKAKDPLSIRQATPTTAIGWTINNTARAYMSSAKQGINMSGGIKTADVTERGQPTGRLQTKNSTCVRFATARNRTHCSLTVGMSAHAWNARRRWKSVQSAEKTSSEW